MHCIPLARSIHAPTDASSAAARATSRAFSYESRPSRIAVRSDGSSHSLRSSQMRWPTVRSPMESLSSQ
jgi:hypothetical protein